MSEAKNKPGRLGLFMQGSIFRTNYNLDQKDPINLQTYTTRPPEPYDL